MIDAVASVAQKRRRAVVILGMHRSGTSLLAKTVALSGVSLARNLMRPQFDNPLGFWESSPISRLNEKMLVDIGYRWDDPRSMPTDWFAIDKRQDEIKAAARVLAAEFPDAELFSLKDPRLSRLLPIWLNVFERLDIQPLFLIACRNPAEVAASLQIRNDIDVEQAQLLWLAYMLDAEKYTRGYPRAVVHYDKMLADWCAELERAYQKIGLDSGLLSNAVIEQVNAYLNKSHQHQKASTDEFLQSSQFSALIKQIYVAFCEKIENPHVFNNGYRELEHIWNIFSTGTEDFASLFQKPLTRPLISSSMKTASTRKIIFHYHFFKNAGTSVDALLKANFGKQWVTREFNAGQHAANITQVKQWVEQEQNASAFSSHTAQLPPPKQKGIEFFPIMFVRHPIDRIASAYAFERKQLDNNGFGAVLARNTTLAGYIDVRLSLAQDRQCRNFHVTRLASMFKGEQENETILALRAIETLPFIGLVEQFDQSIESLCEWLSPHFPGFHAIAVAKNVTRDYSVPLEQKLDAIRAEIGDVCYERLLEANTGDIAVFDVIKQRYDLQAEKSPSISDVVADIEK